MTTIRWTEPARADFLGVVQWLKRETQPLMGGKRSDMWVCRHVGMWADD